jgi:hypothetical protein
MCLAFVDPNLERDLQGGNVAGIPADNLPTKVMQGLVD